MSEPFDGEERRDDPALRARFSAAVKSAAAEAAQEVAYIHRRRLVTWTAIATAVAMCAIGIPLVLLTQQSERNFAQTSALYTCDLFTNASTLMSQAAGNMGSAVGAMSDFVVSDVNLRTEQARDSISKDIAADFEKIIPGATLFKLVHKQQKQNAYSIAQWRTDARHLARYQTGLNTIAGQLAHLGGTNCPAHIGGA